MKLVYSRTTKRIITVLPLDVDEYNQYIDLVPDINTSINNSKDFTEETLKIKNKFEASFGNKEVHRAFNLEEQIKNETAFYVKSYSTRFVILWFKENKDVIRYQLYSRKALQKQLWHFVIDGFRNQNTPLFKNTVLLYAKIFK